MHLCHYPLPLKARLVAAADRETHDRLAKAAFDWCEEVAKKFDAPSPNGAPIAGAGSSGGTATVPAALTGEIECKRSDETPPEGKVFYLASIDWREELYMGAVIDAFAAPINARLQFTVPVEGTAFRVKMALATAVEHFSLTDLKLVSGAKEAAPAPEPAPEQPPPEPIFVPAEYDASHAPQIEAPDGQRAFVATIAVAPPLYAGAKLSATLVPLRTPFDFEVPESPAESFEVMLKLPITAERVVLTEVRITSGPMPAAAAAENPAAETTEAAPAAAAPAAAPAAETAAATAAETAAAPAATEAAAAEATATVVESVFASAPTPAPPAPAPARTKHAPIPLPGIFTATHKPNPKLAQGKTQFSVTMPWDDALMYPKAKVSLYCAPIAKVVQVTLGQKPQSGLMSITLTVPTQSTESFQISGAAIVSGPKPLAPPPPAPMPPVPMPAPMPVPPMGAAPMPAAPMPPTPMLAPMHAFPVATAIPINSIVQQSLLQAATAAQAASAVAVVAQAVQPPSQAQAAAQAASAASAVAVVAQAVLPPSQAQASAQTAAEGCTSQLPAVATQPMGTARKRGRAEPAAASAASAPAVSEAISTAEPWTCQRCTQINQAEKDCSVCGIRKPPMPRAPEMQPHDNSPQWLCSWCTVITRGATAIRCSNEDCRRPLREHGVLQSEGRQRRR